LLLYSGPAWAAGTNFHKAPFDFLFGNHIDTHQENKLTLNKDGSPKALRGFFYIIYMDGTSGTANPVDRPEDAFPDPVSGLPVARHPRGAGEDEVCGETVKCYVGWTMQGLPGQAKFLYHDGTNGKDHPVWLVNRTDEVAPDGTPVSGIPQPGSYTHFHWITDTGDPETATSDPRISMIPSVCNEKNASGLEAAGAANTVCPGWFLQIHAVAKFAFIHGGEIIPVRNGIDNRSHLNLVTNYEIVPAIDPTR
jgi:hypothetical protein